ncbi:invasion associated locus B family protein [Phyllobacterium calauticae]|jgi:invasion protein IalB|uniref:invasion associated locus B family protein n=1 Tax=Phyllobacterium calauticae TaxID=2817027 RepID=UPI001CBF0EB5|nr:invasion associated locus B family protein [Phyllobacterium calauticae]MBZ3691920.1 invasion associated locus B family protein [Phyllobacterium calauticae]
MLKSVLLSLAGAGIAALAIYNPAFAADSGLPGGATSLREQYGAWTVICGVDDKQAKNCVLQQEQVRQVKNSPSQRVLAVEIQPKGKEADALLVLPLGLKLVGGAVLQIDDGKASAANPFRTCVPAGCIVSVKADAKMLALLGNGKSLAVKTTTDDGKEANFAITLDGFQSALNRAVALKN